VTAITRGVRYGLFLCELPPQKPAQQEDDEEVKLDLQYLVAGAVEQLEFFPRALDFIHSASEELKRA
jgi:hypothetical protein